MKTLQRLCAAVALTLVFTLSAFAGDMNTGIGIAPPPAPASATTQGDMDAPRGDMPTGPGAKATAGDSIMEAALNILQSVLSLF